MWWYGVTVLIYGNNVMALYAVSDLMVSGIMCGGLGEAAASGSIVNIVF
jgi:hypothetical protein